MEFMTTFNSLARPALVRSLLALAAPGLLAAPALAASLQISPTSLRFDLTQPRAGALTLSNPSSEPVTVSVDLYSWTQSDGQEGLTPTQDILVNPARFVVPPNGSQIIRVGWRGKSFPTTEKAYRMAIQNVPNANAAAEGIKVQVVLKMNVPVIFASPTAQSKVSWTLSRQGDALQLVAQNSGGRFMSFNDVRLSAGEYKTGLGSFAVLAGGALKFMLPGSAQVKSPLQLSYALPTGTDGERETLTLALP